MPNNLMTLISSSGLVPDEIEMLTQKFNKADAMANEWSEKAKTIKVTSKDQTEEMELARQGRLALRAIRIEVENSRKELKESALRRGQAIDAIAKYLKDLITPIEDYLGQQENFVLIQQQLEDARLLKEAKERQEKERLEAEEKSRKEAEAERKRIEAENAKLRAEHAKQEKALAEERAKAKAAKDEADRLERERQAREATLIAEREAAEKARLKSISDKAEAEDKAKAELEAKEIELEEAKKARWKAEETARQAKETKTKIKAVCPMCCHEFYINDK